MASPKIYMLIRPSTSWTFFQVSTSVELRRSRPLLVRTLRGKGMSTRETVKRWSTGLRFTGYLSEADSQASFRGRHKLHNLPPDQERRTCYLPYRRSSSWSRFNSSRNKNYCYSRTIIFKWVNLKNVSPIKPTVVCAKDLWRMQQDRIGIIWIVPSSL